jgi:NADPH:quinone reductase-like Zn-dependent oxidoreductase
MTLDEMPNAMVARRLLMRTVVSDDCVGDVTPPHWLENAVVDVDQVRLRFGLAEVPRAMFNPDAEYNRGHVLVRVRAFSMNLLDRVYLGDDGTSVLDSTRGIGSDFAAEVVAAGAGVAAFRAGDRVMPCAAWPPAEDPITPDGLPTTTASREFLRIPADKLIRIPDGMVDEVAAAFSVPAQRAFGLVRRLAVESGERALVCGVSSNPVLSNTVLAAITVLIDSGVEVSVLTTSTQHVQALHEMGVVQVFQVHSGGLDETRQYARNIRGFDVVVDSVPGIHLHNAVAMLGFHGRYVACGPTARQGATATGADDGRWNAMLSSLISKNATLFGHHLGVRGDLATAVRRWQAGAFRPIVDSVFTPGDLAGFLHRCFVDPACFGKVVYRYD